MVPFAGVGADDIGRPEAAVSPDRFHPGDHPTEPGHWTCPPRDIGTSPEGRLLSREAGEVLQKAIDALPPSQRLVLTLRDVEGCSTEEVCNALGIREAKPSGPISARMPTARRNASARCCGRRPCRPRKPNPCGPRPRRSGDPGDDGPRQRRAYRLPRAAPRRRIGSPWSSTAVSSGPR
jgi:hypothetical protein